MKQTKTTLLFGVLLAIVVIVWVTLEINSISASKEPDQTGNATTLPTARKTLNTITPIFRSIQGVLFLDSENATK